MYLTAIAWIYVVLMMSVVEAASPNGSVLGAITTFLLYGVLPLAIVLYIMGTPARRKARLARQAQEDAAAQQETEAQAASAAAEPGQPGPSQPGPVQAGSAQPDAGGHAAAGVPGLGADGAAGAPVRKQP